MPAPAIVLTRSAVTYAMDPVPKDGFHIVGSVSQDAAGADWMITVSLFPADPATIDDPDEAATFDLNSRVPFNEAADIAAIEPRLQALVDHVFDYFVPAPTP